MKRAQNHVVDLLFPLIVLGLLTTCAFSVISLSASIYNNQSQDAEDTYIQQTPLAYIIEKVRQNDVNGSITIKTIDNSQVLSMHNADYTTYIYNYEGMLKEITVKDNVSFSLDEGHDIIEVDNFNIEEDDSLFTFTINDSKASVKVRSAS